jgi:probable HAF family extracellular repeat protein
MRPLVLYGFLVNLWGQELPGADTVSSSTFPHKEKLMYRALAQDKSFRRTFLLAAVLIFLVLEGRPMGVWALTYSFTTLNVPGSTLTEAYGINTAGQIVGNFVDTTGEHGFLYTGGSFTPIDVPGSTSTYAYGINNTGQIVGVFYDATGTHGFLYTGGQFTTIDVPDSTDTVASGINTAGQIVGFFRLDREATVHGFVDTGGSFTPIDVPGSVSTDVWGINAASQIVGVFLDTTGYHGFVATPVPTHPPVITISATPATLWPPNGRMVPVTISGTITDVDSDVDASTAAYTVTDEYRQVEPTGSVTLRPDGSYTFTIQLQASRNGNDQDGRHYLITVSAKDYTGNKGSAATGVTVPHDQGH